MGALRRRPRGRLNGSATAWLCGGNGPGSPRRAIACSRSGLSRPPGELWRLVDMVVATVRNVEDGTDRSRCQSPWCRQREATGHLLGFDLTRSPGPNHLRSGQSGLSAVGVSHRTARIASPWWGSFADREGALTVFGDRASMPFPSYPPAQLHEQSISRNIMLTWWPIGASSPTMGGRWSASPTTQGYVSETSPPRSASPSGPPTGSSST